MDRTHQELNGFRCFDFEQPQPRQNICCSRSFGRRVGKLEQLEAALSSYVSTAVRKMRAEGSVASGIQVFINTDRFNKEARQYHNSASGKLPFPSNDLLTILQGCRTTCARSHLYTKALGQTPADHATWQETQRRPLTPSHDGQEIRNCSQAPWQHRPAHTLAPSQMAAGQCLAPQVHGNGRKPPCANADGTDNHTAHRASRLQNQRN